MPRRPAVTDPAAGRVFRRVAVAVALVFALSVALLLVLDVAYVVAYRATAGAHELEHFSRSLLSEETLYAMVLSLGSATTTTALALLVAIPTGYALSRLRIPGKIVVDTLVDAALMLPPLIMGLSLLILFTTLRKAAVRIGSEVDPQPILNFFFESVVYEIPGVVFAQFFVAAAFAIRILKSAFDQADARVENVALTLGCTRFGAFWRVTLPQATSGLLAGAILAWSYSMGIVAPVAILAGTITRRTATLATLAFLEITNGSLEIALALALVMIAIALTILIAFKMLAKRVSGSAELGW